MKTALVIHPRFDLYGGGELLCLHVIKALQDKGYQITLATTGVSPANCLKIFGPTAECLNRVKISILPRFRRVLPRFMAYQHLRYASQIQERFGRSDLVFSTQSSLYYVPGAETYHFIYDLIDLNVVKFSHHFKSSMWKLPYYAALRKYRDMLERPEPTRHFLALSKNISEDLDEVGYANSFIVPPCPLDYGPLPKKDQVVKVTRIVPQKRLEEYIEIARRLPEYPFHILGMTNEVFRRYRDKLLSNTPGNVQYHEAPLRSMPSVLQESKVYLYTSHEPGLPIALIQGIGAGCFPVAPDVGGGAETIELAGLGRKYHTVEGAAEQIKTAMQQIDEGDHIAQAARQFSPEQFRANVQGLID